MAARAARLMAAWLLLLVIAATADARRPRSESVYKVAPSDPAAITVHMTRAGAA